MAVEGKNAVTHHLAGLAARVGEAHTIDHVVQTAFKGGQQVRAGHAFGHVGRDEVAVELLFQHAVNAAYLHLFPQLKRIFADLLAGTAMLARGVGATVLGTLVGVAAIAFQEQFGAFTTAEPAFGVVIFGQG